jgi:hypothetical protein
MKTLIILTTILTFHGEQRVSSSVVTSMEQCKIMRLQLETPRTGSDVQAKAYCSTLQVMK